MKPVHWGVAIIAWVGLSGAPGVISLSAQETSYQGRTFVQWQQELRNESPVARLQAVRALPNFGAQAVPLLTEAIQDTDFNVRGQAIFSLGELGLDAKDAVPALIKTLGHPDWITRRTAAATLGRIGPAAREAAPAVAETAVRDPKGDVRRAARFALTQMGPEARQATVALLHELASSDPNETVKERAAALLGEIEKP
jgi:HEAT repeat protein